MRRRHDKEEAGNNRVDEEEAVMRRACDDGGDKEEAGKDGADEEEADDCGDEEEVQTEAEGIVAWHGRRQIGLPLYRSYRVNQTLRVKLYPFTLLYW